VSSASSVAFAADDDLVTAPEAARMLGVSAPTVRYWLAEGRMPFRRIGSMRVIRRADVEAYQAARASHGAAVS
jgi:excisionase family DNA binding protein